MPKTLFTGDNHFCHENIIKYANRPFANATEMNEAFIKNWNGMASKSDRVFVAGDFALANKTKIREILERLNGYKILIMGNHDGYSPSFYREAGFEEVSKYPIILDNFWIVSHEPMFITESMPYVNIFAHVHNNPEYTDYSSRSICVSVERPHMNYGLITFDRIKELVGQ